MYLVIDIETAPDLDRWSPPADDPNAFPPSYAHRIVCLGFLLLDHEFRLVELNAFQGDERELLLAFSRSVAKLSKADRSLTIVSYNGRTFDLPVLVLRALHHAVPLPWYYRTRGMRYRYDEAGHLDLADALTDYGAGRMVSLDNAAKLIGMPGKVGCDGSKVAELVAQGRIADVVAYCCADVAQTALLLLRFKFVQHELVNQDAETYLREALSHDPRLAALFPQPIATSEVA